MEDMQTYLGRLYSADEVAKLLNIEMVTSTNGLMTGGLKQ